LYNTADGSRHKTGITIATAVRKCGWHQYTLPFTEIENSRHTFLNTNVSWSERLHGCW